MRVGIILVVLMRRKCGILVMIVIVVEVVGQGRGDGEIGLGFGEVSRTWYGKEVGSRKCTGRYEKVTA